MDKIVNICNEYEKKRKKHYLSSWLNLPALIERIIYFPQKDHPNYAKIRKSDFIFDQEFLTWIENENKPTIIDLNNWIFYLKNHCSRITNRNKYLLVYAALACVFAVSFKMVDINKAILIILAIGFLFTIIERSMLTDKKALNEELISLLEHIKSSNVNADGAAEAKNRVAD